MYAAAVALLVCGTGIGFGWRPMPDGSPRYEYVVQLEPEMLEALAAGQSIPLAVEVPAEVQAIGRIRIVVGRQALPRELGVTRLRPTGEDSPGDLARVELTQYTETTPRYGAPPSGATFDAYTQVPPSVGAPASGWNAGPADANPLRVADASAAPGGSSWNAGGDAPSAGPLAAIGAGVRDATAPVRDGVAQFSDQVRAAADGLGDRTQDLLNQLRPDALFGGAAAPTGAPEGTAPPPWNPSAAAPPASEWNGAADPAPAAAGGAAPTTASGPATSWNDDGGPTGAAPTLPVVPPLVTGGGPPTAAGPVRGADASPWYDASDPRFRSDAAGASGAAPTAVAAAPTGGSAPPTGAPPWSSAATTLPDGGVPMWSPSAAGGAGPVLEGPAGPPIFSEMLSQSPTRPLEDGPSPLDAATAAPGGVAAAPVATQGGATAAAPPAAVGGQPTTAPSDGSAARQRAAVLLAWILLTGSVAGNCYLFWSYLDVRTKYRALVRKTARAVGSRFSTA